MYDSLECIRLSCSRRIITFKVRLASLLPSVLALMRATLSNHFARSSTATFWHSRKCAHALLSSLKVSVVVACSAISIGISIRCARSRAFCVNSRLVRLDERIDFQNKTAEPAEDNAGEREYPCCFCFTVLFSAALMESISSRSRAL